MIPLATVEIELLGVARLLAGRDSVAFPASEDLNLRDLLRSLAEALPSLVGTVLSEDGDLLAGHVLSRDGAALLRNPGEAIYPGDRLLLLSTSAGG